MEGRRTAGRDAIESAILPVSVDVTACKHREFELELAANIGDIWLRLSVDEATVFAKGSQLSVYARIARNRV